MKRHVFFITMILFFVSCSSQTRITIEENYSAKIAFKMDSGTILQTILQSFGLTDASKPFFDEEKIRTSIAQSNLQIESLAFPSRNSIELTANVQNIERITKNQTDFIMLNKKQAQTELKLIISSSTIQEVIKIMPSDNLLYLDLLFAPIFTGEVLSKEEYLALIAGAYGSNAVKELENARITIQLQVPGTINQLTASNDRLAVSKYEKNTATISFNLAELLTTTDIVEYTIAF